MTKPGKLLATVIDGGTINRAEYSVRHIGRTRDLEKVSAREAGVGFAVHGSQLAVGGGLFGGCSGLVGVAQMGLMGPMGLMGTI